MILRCRNLQRMKNHPRKGGRARREQATPRTNKEAGSMSWSRREFGTCSRNIKNEGGETSEK
jgi:hypothetical protein